MRGRVDAWYAEGTRIPVRLADGSRVAVWARASGQGPATWFLHGFPTCSLDWLWVEDELRGAHVPGRRVHVDLLGFGNSDKPRRRYRFDDQVQIVAAVAAALDVQEAHLVVHDYSVSLAMELLARRAEGAATVPNISSVLFLNGGLFPAHYRPLPIQRLLAAPVIGPWVARVSHFDRFGRSMTRICSKEHPPTRGELEALWAVMIQKGGKQAIARLSRYHHERRVQAHRWTHALTTTDVPLRFAWGAADPISGAMVPEIRRRVPHAPVTVWDDVGHYPQLEVPVRVAAEVVAMQEGLAGA